VSSFLSKLLRPLGAPTEPSEPTHGVSSFHLWWQEIENGEPFTEASATLEILQAPSVDRLYFWAFQVSFLEGEHSTGSAHIGLQWNPKHPNNRAVNWGGYSNVADVTSILEGTTSPLPSAPNDPNTRDFPWQENTPYRFRVSRAYDGWRGDVTNVSTGRVEHVRTLRASGSRLNGFVVWAEVFAGCKDPRSMARWSDFEAKTASGQVKRPATVRTSFPNGGDCPNTDVLVDGAGLVLLTNARRTAPSGGVLPVPR
jgi:hypothetical protein